MSRRLPALAALAALLILSVSPVASQARSASSARMSPGLAHTLAIGAPSARTAAFVSVQNGLDPATVLTGRTGITVIKSYPRISAAFVVGTVSALTSLAKLSSVAYLEDNRTLQFFGDTSSWASRARVTQEAAAGGPYTDASGNRINGAGVGIAIVDAGINAAHPDLTSRVAHNWKIVCSTPGLINTETEYCFGNQFIDETLGNDWPSIGFVDMPAGTTSDTTSGHGTHVAGIAAGTGAMSTGAYPAGTA